MTDKNKLRFNNATIDMNVFFEDPKQQDYTKFQDIVEKNLELNHFQYNESKNLEKTLEWGQIFDEMHQLGLIEKNTAVAKSDWIGQRMNRSGRTIRRYWEEMNLKNAGTEIKKESEILTNSKKTNSISLLNSRIQKLEKTLSKKETIQVVYNEKNQETLNHIKALENTIKKFYNEY